VIVTMMPTMASIRKTQVLSVDLTRKRLPRPLMEAATRFLNRLLGFGQFNAVYGQLPECAAVDFSRTFLDALQVRVELAGQPSDSIPADGPLIVIANHPCGLLDGMVLDALLRSIRPDVTVMAIHLLAMIPEYRDRWVFVGRRRSRSKRKLSVRGWRQSFQCLVRGGALVVFPASRVSRFQWRRRAVADEPWSSHIATFARRTGAPVLPGRLHGRGNWGFQLAGMVLPLLQNIRSVGAVSSYRGRTLHASIGRLIHPGELSDFATDDEATAFLRHETDRLAGS
jgi:putative hemolysin